MISLGDYCVVMVVMHDYLYHDVGYGNDVFHKLLWQSLQLWKLNVTIMMSPTMMKPFCKTMMKPIWAADNAASEFLHLLKSFSAALNHERWASDLMIVIIVMYELLIVIVIVIVIFIVIVIVVIVVMTSWPPAFSNVLASVSKKVQLSWIVSSCLCIWDSCRDEISAWSNFSVEAGPSNCW